MGRQLVKQGKFIGSERQSTKVSSTQRIPYTNPYKVKEGDLVEARFTNSGNMFRFPARVVKVNKETVRVVRADGKSVWEGDDPNREFTIPKLESQNNGIFPLQSGIEKKQTNEATYREFRKRYAEMYDLYKRGEYVEADKIMRELHESKWSH